MSLDSVVPAGGPIHGGTNLTIAGSGFAQADHVLTDGYVRCLFDAEDPSEPLTKQVLPQATPISFRNDTHINAPRRPRGTAARRGSTTASRSTSP